MPISGEHIALRDVGVSLSSYHAQGLEDTIAVVNVPHWFIGTVPYKKWLGVF